MSTTQVIPPDFQSTRTCRNLVTACQETMLSRKQYLRAGEACEAAGLHVVAHAFRFTAAQEKEQAAIFHGMLHTNDGAPVHPSSVPDTPLPDNPQQLLMAAGQTERAKAEQLFPTCARIALEEGYPRIASAFRHIADTERLHAHRFQQYAQALSDGTLFVSPEHSGWFCLPCGHLHYGFEAPLTCDACGCSRGHFIRSDFHPFFVSPFIAGVS